MTDATETDRLLVRPRVRKRWARKIAYGLIAHTLDGLLRQPAAGEPTFVETVLEVDDDECEAIAQALASVLRSLQHKAGTEWLPVRKAG
jgi:hypothetical protein